MYAHNSKILQTNNSHGQVSGRIILILGLTRDPVHCFWLTFFLGKEVCMWWSRDEAWGRQAAGLEYLSRVVKLSPGNTNIPCWPVFQVMMNSCCQSGSLLHSDAGQEGACFLSGWTDGPSSWKADHTQVSQRRQRG